MIKEMVGKRMSNLSDHTIANNAMAAKAASSNAYLAASLAASTPELKQLFSANMTQMIGEHTALLALSENKGWVKPYEQPEKLLKQTVNHSNEVLGSNLTD